jgi:hypothetical protein
MVQVTPPRSGRRRDLFAFRPGKSVSGECHKWMIAVDSDGIRTATWEATDFAQQPLEAQTEGLTALPGGTETYTRTADGLMDATRDACRRLELHPPPAGGT